MLFSKSKNQLTLRKDVDTILAEMKGLDISSDEQFQETGTFLQGIKGKQKEVKDHFEPERIEYYTKYQAVMKNIRTYTNPLGEAEGIVKQKLSVYRVEQEQKHREEEQKKLVEARKKEEERLLAEAEETGDDSILDDEIIVPPPVVETEVPKMKGISFTTVWKFALVNVDELPREYMILDIKKIQGVISALKEATNIPGIRVFSEQQVGARAT